MGGKLGSGLPVCRESHGLALNGFVWVRFGLLFGGQKPTSERAVIGFFPFCKMGSFGKNTLCHSDPFRDVHGQRRRHRLTQAPSLQPLQLVHGPMQLPFQLGLIPHDLVQHFR